MAAKVVPHFQRRFDQFRCDEIWGLGFQVYLHGEPKPRTVAVESTVHDVSLIEMANTFRVLANALDEMHHSAAGTTPEVPPLTIIDDVGPPPPGCWKNFDEAPAQ